MSKGSSHPRVWSRINPCHQRCHERQSCPCGHSGWLRHFLDSSQSTQDTSCLLMRRRSNHKGDKGDIVRTRHSIAGATEIDHTHVIQCMQFALVARSFHVKAAKRAVRRRASLTLRDAVTDVDSTASANDVDGARVVGHIQLEFCSSIRRCANMCHAGERVLLLLVSASGLRTPTGSRTFTPSTEAALSQHLGGAGRTLHHVFARTRGGFESPGGYPVSSCEGRLGAACSLLYLIYLGYLDCCPRRHADHIVCDAGHVICDAASYSMRF